MHTIAAISPSEFLARTFHTAVFAGGGNRCWWQAGAVERFNITPKNIVWRNLLRGERPFVLPRTYPD